MNILRQTDVILASMGPGRLPKGLNEERSHPLLVWVLYPH